MSAPDEIQSTNDAQLESARREVNAWAAAYAAAREHRDTARDALAEQVRMAVAAGMSESEAARVARVDRMTIRKWLGKHRRRAATFTSASDAARAASVSAQG